MASIKDVAKEAGVSVATVSRVINGAASVSESTHTAVLDAINKLGYKPNLFGKNLRQSRTKIIMVMLSSIANTFCSSVIRSIDRAASVQGYYTMVCATDGLPKKEQYYVNFAQNGFFDGIIILNSNLSAVQMAALSASMPTVQCNEFVDTVSTPYVSINNEKAAFDAVNTLIASGKRRVVFYTVQNNLISTADRFKGYLGALKSNGIEFDERLVLCGNYGYRNAIDTFNAFLNTGTHFDSIFAISDRMAAGAVKSLISSGYSVPGDVKVIGFDNTDISYTSTPQITTVSQPHFLLGKYAFEMLERLIEGKKAENIILPHKIIFRNSTGRGESKL